MTTGSATPVLRIGHEPDIWYATGRTPDGGFLAFAKDRTQLVARIDETARRLGWKGWTEK